MTNDVSFEQQSIIIGSLLGDGSISKKRYKNGNCYFSKSQCLANRSYIEWHFDKLNPFSSSLTDHTFTVLSKKYMKTVFLTKSHLWFTCLREKWYPDGKKIVPKDLVLDPLSIAIWFFDDGSNYVEKRQARFSTNCFTPDELDFLSNQLSRFSICVYQTKSNELQVKTESYKLLVELVSPYMLWDCFKHKIRYRDSELDFTTDEEARKIFELYDLGHQYVDIAKEIGKSISVVSSILRGDRMKHLGLAQPTHGLSLNNTSGYKNVYWEKDRKKWKASIKKQGKNTNLGRFNTKEEAVDFLKSIGDE